MLAGFPALSRQAAIVEPVLWGALRYVRLRSKKCVAEFHNNHQQKLMILERIPECSDFISEILCDNLPFFIAKNFLVASFVLANT